MGCDRRERDRIRATDRIAHAACPIFVHLYNILQPQKLSILCRTGRNSTHSLVYQLKCLILAASGNIMLPSTSYDLMALYKSVYYYYYYHYIIKHDSTE